MEFPRAAGILLHPTSLPSHFGIGDLGPEAYAFADFLIRAGQSLWQVLPLGPTGYGHSPYACYSAFAGNALLISPERLVVDNLLTAEDLSSISFSPKSQADFEEARVVKDALLRKAYARFKSADDPLTQQFEVFKSENGSWLDDYALFRALKTANNGKAWHEWETALAKREETALSHAGEELGDDVSAEKFFQFLFFRQWNALRVYCNQRGVSLIGDIPMFVAHDSADVWINQEQFKLDEQGLPLVVSGVPPDYFSSTGQFWGNPIYDWQQMSSDGFRWWIDRLRASLGMFDVVRLDHFRGFAACWEIPAGDTTAEHGSWVEAPGRELLESVRAALGDLPIIAENLGVITPDVEKLREDFGFPGMRVLQFAFSGDSENLDLPHNYNSNVVAYTGTHDNNTTVGWFNGLTGGDSTRTASEVQSEREFCKNYLNSNGHEIHWDFMRATLASVANTAIIPLQDVLGLGSDARMNLPNSVEGNWLWRVKKGALTEELSTKLGALTGIYGRKRLKH